MTERSGNEARRPRISHESATVVVHSLNNTRSRITLLGEVGDSTLEAVLRSSLGTLGVDLHPAKRSSKLETLSRTVLSTSLPLYRDVAALWILLKAMKARDENMSESNDVFDEPQANYGCPSLVLFPSSLPFTYTVHPTAPKLAADALDHAPISGMPRA